MKPKNKVSKIFHLFLLTLLLSFSFHDCAPEKKVTQGHNHNYFKRPLAPIPVRYNSPTIFTLAQDLAAQLRANLRDGEIGDWPCLITSLVDIDDLKSSSRFGRVLSEALSSEIFRQGGRVKEIRSARAVFVVPKTGELMLSRDVKQLARDINARAIIVGTYSIGAYSVIVNLKMIDLYNSNILSVATAEIGRTKTIDSLLGEQSTLEEEPVPNTYDSMPL